MGACGGLIMVLFTVVLHLSSSWSPSVNCSLFSVSRTAFSRTTGSSEFISWIKLARGEIRWIIHIRSSKRKDPIQYQWWCSKFHGEGLLFFPAFLRYNWPMTMCKWGVPHGHLTQVYSEEWFLHQDELTYSYFNLFLWVVRTFKIPFQQL